MADRCICCGEIIPEGRQVCPRCQASTCKNHGVTIKPDGIHDLSPHQYEEDVTLRNVTIQILRCKICGKVSIGWRRQENTEEV